ncbi:MAG TPA: DUF3015 family protein [Bdellovibrionales bacterium]|nr:DUF3015 family protein [Bdellovibrionales bacterium]
MKLQMTLIALIAVFGSSAFAASLGPAGCGLGYQVFKKDNQVLAATTNGSSGTQTFGISSGTSDCEQGQDTAAVMFIETNQIALANEAARGQGETLASLANVMGCSDAPTFAAAMKANYETIFSTHRGNSIAISRSIRGTVNSTPALANTCQNRG